MNRSSAPAALKLTFNAPPPPVWLDPKSINPINGWVAAVAGVRSEIAAYRNGPAENGLDHTAFAAVNWMIPDPTFSHTTVLSAVSRPSTVPNVGGAPPEVPAAAHR